MPTDETWDEDPLTHQVQAINVLLEVLITEEACCEIARSRDSVAISALKTPRFFYILRCISGLRDTHAALLRDPSETKPDRLVRSLWFTALEQRFQNRSAKHEIARAWIMYNDLWPQLVEQQKIKVPAPYSSAIASLPHALFLLMSMLQSRGYVPNVETLFAATSLQGDVLESFLSLYTNPASELPASAPVRQYPKEFLNPFGEQPILRIGKGRLISPDPYVLFGGLEFRLLRQALSSAMESLPADRERGFRDASSAFGFVFEAYCRLLLDSAFGATVLPEFRYERSGAMVDSADAFIVGNAPLVFEFKSMRFPFDLHQASTVNGFARWVTELTGGKDGRGAFEQGAAFFRDVTAGLCPTLPITLPNDALYVVVAYEDVPSCANWDRLRDKFWPPGTLSVDAIRLAKQAVFISMRDLETATTVATFEAANGRDFDLGVALRSWYAVVKKGPTAFDLKQHRLPDSFRDFLLRRYPKATGHFQQLHRDAFNKFQKATLDIGFSESTTPEWPRDSTELEMHSQYDEYPASIYTLPRPSSPRARDIKAETKRKRKAQRVARKKNRN